MAITRSPAATSAMPPNRDEAAGLFGAGVSAGGVGSGMLPLSVATGGSDFGRLGAPFGLSSSSSVDCYLPMEELGVLLPGPLRFLLHELVRRILEGRLHLRARRVREAASEHRRSVDGLHGWRGRDRGHQLLQGSGDARDALVLPR